MIRTLDHALQNQRYQTYLRAVSIAVWLFLMALWFSDVLSDTFSRLPVLLGIFANILVGIFALFSISGSLVLWVSMIYYWRHFDARAPSKRALWFPIILFGFCFGAGIYCWLRMNRAVGREAARAVLSVSSAKSGRQRRSVRLLGMLTAASLTVCLILGFLGYPLHHVISQGILGSLVMVFVPVAMILTLAYVLTAIFSKSVR